MLTKKHAVKSKRKPRKKIPRASKQKNWVNWHFHGDEDPFNSRMTNAEILAKRHAIENFLQRHLSDQHVWQQASLVFTPVILISKWAITGNNPMVLHLTADAVDPTQPPDSSVAVPPPPHQPPPPTIF